jgi:hypothetical protein
MFNWITIGEIKHVFIVLYPAQTFVGFLFDTINTKTKGTRFVAVFFISCTLDSWCRFLIKKKKLVLKTINNLRRAYLARLTRIRMFHTLLFITNIQLLNRLFQFTRIVLLITFVFVGFCLVYWYRRKA